MPCKQGDLARGRGDRCGEDERRGLREGDQCCDDLRNEIPTRIGIGQRIVHHIGIPVVARDGIGELHDDVGR